MKNKLNIGNLIPTYCLKFNDEYVPFWKLKYVNDEDFSDDRCSEGYYLSTESKYSAQYSELTKCYYDLTTEKIVFGKIIDVYPDIEKVDYKFGDDVTVSVEYGCVQISSISDYKFDKYSSTIKMVSDFEDYEIEAYNIKKLGYSDDDIVEIRHFDVTYVLSNGKEVEGYKLTKIVK